MLFTFQEALLTTPIAHSGRPEVVPRSSQSRFKRTFWSFGAPIFGGCLSRFAVFCFFMFLVYHAHDQNRQPLLQIRVLRVLYVFLGAPGRCAGAAFCDFFVLRVFVACCFLMTPITDPLLLFLNMSPRNRFWLRRRSVL